MCKYASLLPLLVFLIILVTLIIKNKAITPYKNQGRKSMKDRIDSLEAIGAKARKIATEIAGNYVIAVSTEAAKKKKYLCIYRSGKGLNFTKGSTHQRELVKAFPYSNEEGYVSAYKSALKHIAVLEHKMDA